MSYKKSAYSSALALDILLFEQIPTAGKSNPKTE